MGVQLKDNLSFLLLDTHVIRTSITCTFNVSYSFSNLCKVLLAFFAQKKFSIDFFNFEICYGYN